MIFTRTVIGSGSGFLMIFTRTGIGSLMARSSSGLTKMFWSVPGAASLWLAFSVRRTLSARLVEDTDSRYPRTQEL